MKCPKCGYLGFETTDRCRNCGYDFSLASPEPAPELALSNVEVEAPMTELALQGADAEQPAAGGLAIATDDRAQSPAPELMRFPSEAPTAPATGGEELPLFPPRPARSPLVVRRAATEAPRTRRTTTRPVRSDAKELPLSLEKGEKASQAARGSAARLENATLPARLGAAVFDCGLLVAIDVMVVWLTLRIAGLSVSREDLALIRSWPMAAFLLLLAFLYVAGFTLGGGQTLGKMAFRLRVIGDGGRPVDAAGAILRGVGCVLSVLSLGLLFVPALMTGERRALHDRLAGTRVVKA
jgi:uncharacterized RDD family membrane protein YckC